MTQSLKSIKPSIFIIFGITGDLSQRYLLPSLLELVKLGVIDEHTTILGISRSEREPGDVLANLRGTIDNEDQTAREALKTLEDITTMVKLDLSKPEDYDDLRARIDQLEEDRHTCMDRVFYLAIPPEGFEDVVNGLSHSDLNDKCQHNEAESRLLIEKPFGHNYDSAEELFNLIDPFFDKKQIYLIDHYLSKETVENLVTFRFNNDVFEPVWNGEHIESVSIYAHETLGIEGRVDFYEPLGALKDFIQSHLLQVLSLVAMEKPHDDSSEALHESKLRVLKHVELYEDLTSSVTRGQYQNYRNEVGNEDSTTETYARLELKVNNPRWQGTKFSVETGKSMDEREAGIKVKFRGDNANVLDFRIQPNEGINLNVTAKQPGLSTDTDSIKLDYTYGDMLNEPDLLPDAYERVIISAILGDQSRFATIDEILACWKIVQPTLSAWSDNSSDIVFYESGKNPAGAV